MKTPKKSIKKYCGGDHCTMLWNLPCSEDHGLPKKSKKKMYKYYVLCNNCGKSNVHLIPFGTKVQDHMQKPKLWKDSCKFCGC